MFICQVTGKHSERGEACNKIVVATRERVYTKRVKNEDTNKWEDVEVGRGWEIVREINASEEGVQVWNELTPEERTMFVKSLA
jgi:hypothetical protein